MIIKIISFTTLHMQMQIHWQIQMQADSFVQDTYGFINFLSLDLLHEERDTILAMLTSSQRTAHLVVFKISVGRHPKILTATATGENSTFCLNGRELKCLPPWSNVNFQLILFQNPQILRTISSGHDVVHTPAPFPVWRFIMIIVIVISFAHERKTSPNDWAPELRAE